MSRRASLGNVDITEVFVATTVFYNYKTQEHKYLHCGPYTTPGKAKAMRTRIEGEWSRYSHYGIQDFDVVDRYVSQATGWTKI